MQYVAQPGDGDKTTIRMDKRVRRKLGLIMNGNTHPDQKIVELIDNVLETQ